MSEIDTKMVKPENLEIIYPGHQAEGAIVKGVASYESGTVIAIVYLYNAAWVVQVRVRESGGQPYMMRAFISNELKTEAEAWVYARDRALRVLAAIWTVQRGGKKFYMVNPWKMAGANMQADALREFAEAAAKEFDAFDKIDVSLVVLEGTEEHADLGLLHVGPPDSKRYMEYGPVMLNTGLTEEVYRLIKDIELRKKGM